jgi:hypothetical protein
MAESQNVIVPFSIAIFLLLILLLVVTYNSKCQIDNVERFNQNMDNTTNAINNKEFMGSYSDDEPFHELETTGSNQVDQPTQVGPNTDAASCPQKDKLTSADLLPIDAQSKWASINPQCSGDVQDQNYLTAGYHIGINTVGQSMRNANLQLRYEPPNPQVPVSPWQISTIEPEQRISGLMDIGSPPTY